MSATTRTNLRIIGAIAAKDIGDAVKNRLILQTVVTVLLMVVFYRALPVLTGLAGRTEITVYDADDSPVTLALEDNSRIDLRSVSSFEEMGRFLAMGGTPELGLVVPSGTAAGGSTPIEIDGYTQHWVSPAAAAALASRIEDDLSAALARPVQIRIEGHRIYPTLVGLGPHTWVSMSTVLVLVMLGMGLTPQLMLEEKRTHTLEALLVSPASSQQVVAGKAVAGLAYCLAGAAIVLAANAAQFVQWGWAILGALCGTLLAVAIGLFLGLVALTMQSLRMWVAAVIVPLFVLPVAVSEMASFMPAAVIAAVRWVPSVALSRLLILSMSNVNIVGEAALDLALLLVPTALILAAVAWRLNREP